MNSKQCKCIACRYAEKETRNCEANCHSTLIQKAVCLLTDPITESCCEQHLFTLNAYANACKDGYYLDDLPNLIRVLQILQDHIHYYKIYRKPLAKLLKNASHLLVHNFGDITSNLEAVKRYFSTLAYFLVALSDIRLRKYVYNALTTLFTPTEWNLILKDYRVCHAATVLSSLPETLTKLFAFAPKHEFWCLLKLTSAITKVSHITFAHRMINEGAMNNLIMLLVPDRNELRTNLVNLDITDCDFLEMVCDILLYLARTLQYLDKSDSEKVIPGETAFWALAGLLRTTVKKNPTNMCRNKLAEFIVLCLYSLPHIPYYKWCLANDIIILSLAPERHTDNNWASNVSFNHTSANITFKKMMISTFFLMEKYPCIQELLVTHSVLQTLLKVIRNCIECYCYGCVGLSKYAYIALYFVGPMMMDAVLQYEVHERLLLYLQKNMKSKYPVPGTSIAILQILLKLTQTKNQTLITSMSKAYYLDSFNTYCHCIYSKDALSMHDQKILSYIFCILKELYQNEKVNKVSPVTIIRNYLARVCLRKQCDTNFIQMTLLSAFDLLWEVFQHCDAYVDLFLTNGGVYSLIDALQMSTDAARHIGLACLLHVSDRESIYDYLQHWPGGPEKRNEFILQLASLFPSEKLHPSLESYTEDTQPELESQLSDTKDITDKTTLPRRDSFTEMPNGIDLIEACRLRAASFMKRLLEIHLVQENSKGFPHQFTFAKLSENYASFKLAQAWAEVFIDLNRSGIILANIDKDMQKTVQDKLNKWQRFIDEDELRISQSASNLKESVSDQLLDATNVD